MKQRTSTLERYAQAVDAGRRFDVSRALHAAHSEPTQQEIRIKLGDEAEAALAYVLSVYRRLGAGAGVSRQSIIRVALTKFAAGIQDAETAGAFTSQSTKEQHELV